MFLIHNEREKVTWEHVWGVQGVNVAMEYSVQPNTTAQTGTTTPVYCHNELSTHQKATVLVIYSKLHLADTLVLPNKNTGLHFGLVEHSHGAQNPLDQKMSYASTLPTFASNLACCLQSW